MNVLMQGCQQLAESLQRDASQTITYTRGDSSVSLKATKGKSQASLEELSGVSLAAQMDDWIIQANDLKLNGKLTVPRPDDEIESEFNDKKIRWRVASHGNPDDCWSWLDPNRIMMRIHVFEVGRD